MSTRCRRTCDRKNKSYCQDPVPINTVVNSNNETHHTSLFRGRALVGVVRVSRDCCRKILSCLKLNRLGYGGSRKGSSYACFAVEYYFSFFFFSFLQTIEERKYFANLHVSTNGHEVIPFLLVILDRRCYFYVALIRYF